MNADSESDKNASENFKQVAAEKDAFKPYFEGMVTMYKEAFASLKNEDPQEQYDLAIKPEDNDSNLYHACLLYTSPSPRDRG